ncbi:MAG: DUF3604 domain-containing protein [Pseudomonadota bacterium]
MKILLRLFSTPLALVSLGGCEKIADPSLDATRELDPVQQTTTASATAVEQSAAATNAPGLGAGSKRVFFGDLHIHTSFSADAYIMGVRSTPDDAYRFAQGKSIEHALGFPVRLRRPLEFAAVTDHAEYLGQAASAGLDIPSTRDSLERVIKTGDRLKITKAWLETSLFTALDGLSFPQQEPTVNLAAWRSIIDAAERHNRPGEFTAFIGYEWSAWGDSNREHQHRNVIYRGAGVSTQPFSALDSEDPEALWRFLAKEAAEGREAIAISHNANFSAGRMFAKRSYSGETLDTGYAALRNRFEPLSEIFQIKGQSEAHPLLSRGDEFANFEVTSMSFFRRESKASLKGSYARSALLSGLWFSRETGFNPFQFGMIGSSDSHNASSPVEEDNYHGKLPMLDGTAGLRTNQATFVPNRFTPARRWGSGGLAAVWAEENTRESLFDAMQKREVYATSGPRMRVRFVGAFIDSFVDRFVDNSADSLDVESEQPNRAEITNPAFDSGTPMGGLLRPTGESSSPSFLLSALKDPLGANLDRLQIIKGWVDAEGVTHERVFDVAGSGQRRLDPQTHRLAPIENTVDALRGRYRNTVGAKMLNTVWTDPDFDRTQTSFYYARVLEIPTPRWSTYDAVALRIKPMQPVSIQERAVTSPIWYVPEIHGPGIAEWAE